MESMSYLRKKNKIVELHFDAAHYLSEEFGKCMSLHGHRWHVKNLTYEQTKVIDFNLISKVIENFDHCLIVPEKHVEFWLKVKEMASELNLPFTFKLKPIPNELTTVEAIAEALKKELENLGISNVHFELYEGDNYCTIV